MVKNGEHCQSGAEPLYTERVNLQSNHTPLQVDQIVVFYLSTLIRPGRFVLAPKTALQTKGSFKIQVLSALFSFF